MLVVLRECNYVALGRHAQAATPTHLHVRTLELGRHGTTALQHHDVKTIAVAVTYKNVARVTCVNSIGICCQRLVSDATEKRPVL